MTKSEEKKLLEELYNEYGFIEEDISKFEEIVFSRANKKMAKEEVKSLAKANAVMYIVEKIEDKQFIDIFTKALNKLGLLKASTIFDTILKQANINILPEDFEVLVTNDQYKDLYEKYIKNKEKYESTLLGDILEAYSSFNEEIEINDTEILSRVSDDQARDYYLLISQFSVLTREEEKELIKKYRETQDTYYRDEFINHNLKLVVNIAYNYWSKMAYGSLSLMDLIQEGNIGLLTAFNKFNPDRGFKFSTYAYWWIKQKIKRAIADKNDTVRTPVHLAEKINKMKKYIREYSNQFEVEPTDEEIIEFMGITPEFLKIMRNAEAIKTPISMDAAIENPEERKGRESSLIQFLTDESAENVEDKAINDISREQFENLISETFDMREKIIIKNRFGFNEHSDIYTLQEIGDKLGITRERVRQIEKKALIKLSKRLKAQKRAEENMVIRVNKEEAKKEIEEKRKIFEEKLRRKTKTLTVERYSSDNLSVTVKCEKCGNVHTDTMDALLKENKCYFCYSQKIDKEEEKNKILNNFNDKLEKLSGGKLKIVEVEDDLEKVKVKCLDCNDEWSIYKYNLTYNPKCPSCANKNRIKQQIEKIQNKIDEKNDKIKIIEYSSSRIKVLFRCSQCGYEWEELPYNLLKKPYCPNCKKLEKQLKKNK